MIGFVLNDARRVTVGRHRELFSVTIEGLDANIGRSRHLPSNIWNTETAFPVFLGRTPHLGNFWIDNHDGWHCSLVVVDTGHKQSDALMHLRTGQSDSLAIVHGVKHVIDEPLNSWGRDLVDFERTSALAQHGMPHARDLQDGHEFGLYVSVTESQGEDNRHVPSPNFTPMQPHEHGSAYRYCPACAQRLESRQLKMGDRKRLVCVGCGNILYLDPKVAVGTIIAMPDTRIVMVRRAIEPGYGLWVFPGGYVDRGEVVSTAAIREAREEAGINIRLDGLVSIYSYPDRPPVIIVYAATAITADLRHDDESLEIATFSESEIPWEELAFRSTREALRDYFHGVIHPHCC